MRTLDNHEIRKLKQKLKTKQAKLRNNQAPHGYICPQECRR